MYSQTCLCYSEFIYEVLYFIAHFLQWSCFKKLIYEWWLMVMATGMTVA